MLELMQHHPLLISSLLEHAATAHRDAQVVSLVPGATAHRCGYADIARRARQVAGAMRALGIAEGDRVGTMAWNGHRHLELFFGVSGTGAVLHTLSPRLVPAQIAYIANHAEDQVLFFDVAFAPLVAELAPQLTGVRHFVAMTDREHLPGQTIPNLLCYEDLIAAQNADFDWPELDERAASSLCYTSGTTGNPKGVLYSHRSTLLHASLVCMADGVGTAARDMLFMAAPMFHVNAWGMPYACALSGASMVLPGSGLDGASIYSAMKAERDTGAAHRPAGQAGRRSLRRADQAHRRRRQHAPARRPGRRAPDRPRALGCIGLFPR